MEKRDISEQILEIRRRENRYGIAEFPEETTLGSQRREEKQEKTEKTREKSGGELGDGKTSPLRG